MDGVKVFLVIEQKNRKKIVQEFQESFAKVATGKKGYFLCYQELGLDIIGTLNYDQKMHVEMNFVKGKIIHRKARDYKHLLVWSPEYDVSMPTLRNNPICMRCWHLFFSNDLQARIYKILK